MAWEMLKTGAGICTVVCSSIFILFINKCRLRESREVFLILYGPRVYIRVKFSSMGIWSILLVAVGLAMDSLAVSVSGGIVMRPFSMRQSLRLALTMGIFQAGMTLLGWALGVGFSSYITAYDHWIAFVLLAFLGGKMIYESFGEEDHTISSFSLKTLCTLGVATSIDALAVGVFLGLMMWVFGLPAVVCGLVAWGFSLAGVWGGYVFVKIMGVTV